MRFDRVTVVIKRWGYGSGVGVLFLGVAEATNEVDGLAEKVFRRLLRSRLHQLEFERELLGFGAAFRGEIVFAIEHVQRTRQDIGVIGFAHDALGERALMRNIRRDPSLIRRGGFAQDDTVWLTAGILWRWRWVVFANTFQAGFQFVLPLAIAVGGDVFGADSGDRLQQELGEIAEGNGVFAGDASLGHEEKGLGEGAVDAGGGGEVGAKRFQRRRVRYALGAALWLGSVMSAELGRIDDFFIPNRRKLILLVDFRRITTLASIGKSELATRSGRVKRGPSLRFVAQDADPGRIGEFVRRHVGGRFCVALRLKLGNYGL